jgi:hypothetical protein
VALDFQRLEPVQQGQDEGERLSASRRGESDHGFPLQQGRHRARLDFRRRRQPFLGQSRLEGRQERKIGKRGHGSSILCRLKAKRAQQA